MLTPRFSAYFFCPAAQLKMTVMGADTNHRTLAGTFDMPLWSMDDWKYVDRKVVADPKGRQWSVALMDVLGQEGDPDMPSMTLELQYASGRYFTLIYSATGAVQWERGHTSLAEATSVYERLLTAVSDGRLDPAQPVFREDLED